MSAARALRACSVAALGLAVLRALTVPRRVTGDDTDIYLDSVEALWRGGYDAIQYPPGMALLLTPVRWVAWPTSASFVSVLLAGALIVAVWALALHLGGHGAAAVAAACCGLSPVVYRSGVWIMADGPAALVLVLALLAITRRRWILAGALVGFSAWLRLAHLAFAAVLLRRRALLLGGLPVVGALVAFQLAVYGSLSGYPSGRAEFALEYIQDPLYRELVTTPAVDPNWLHYPMVLLGRWWYVVPLVPVFAAPELWRRRSEPIAQAALAVVVLNLAVYQPYFFQAARFMLPAVVVLIPFAATTAVRLVAAAFRRPDLVSGEPAVAPPDRALRDRAGSGT